MTNMLGLKSESCGGKWLDPRDTGRGRGRRVSGAEWGLKGCAIYRYPESSQA